MMNDPVPALTHKDFLLAAREKEKAALAARLRYIKDTSPGISRVKKGKGFAYYFQNKPVREIAALRRIRGLVIPPAWINVWICPVANGHIQATGYDLRQRKQYRYHELWNQLRNETKFHRLYEFGKSLPRLRLQVEQDLAMKELSQQKVLAAVIRLMETTYIRVGNSTYEKTNGSYGITTLKDRHVAIEGDKMLFSFKGKKGITHRITLKNKRLARMVKQCRDIPGRELFQYYDAAGNPRPVDSGMVNQYIHEAAGSDYSAKDFRTWAGSVHALQAFCSMGPALTATAARKNIVTALDQVSSKLGNTRSVCKKYYVHPALIRLYEENNLFTCLQQRVHKRTADADNGLTPAEHMLMAVLQQTI